MEWNAKSLATLPKHLQPKLKKGRGCGSGANYLAWYTTREIKSRGTCDNPTSVRNNRRYELLSNFESIYFHVLEPQEQIRDVREQFPIFDLARTTELAVEEGINYKKGSKGKIEPYTIDFLIDEVVGGRRKLRAASIKPPGQDLDDLTKAKLKVEYRWCAENGIDWELVDLSSLDDPLITLSTLRFMRGWFAHGWTPDVQLRQLFRDAFLDCYERNVPLAEILRKVSRRIYLNRERTEDTFRYAAWARDIALSTNHEVAFNRPVVLKHAV